MYRRVLQFVFLFILFLALFIFDPKVIYAGSCTGQLNCGTQVEVVGHCSDNSPCYSNSNCAPPGPGGSCIGYSLTCNSNGGTAQCSCSGPDCGSGSGSNFFCVASCGGCATGGGCTANINPPPPPTATPVGSTPGPTPSGGGLTCGQGCTDSTQCGGGLVCDSNAHICWGGGCGGGGPTPVPQVACGGLCSSNADCTVHAAAAVVTCSGGRCTNVACIQSGGTVNSDCSCTGYRDCGASCGTSIGINCLNNSYCAYVNMPGGNCPFTSTSTYCVGAANPNYTRPNCKVGDTGNQYLLGPGGQDTGFTLTDIASTCACTTPGTITNTLRGHNGPWTGGTLVTLAGATLNAYNLIQSAVSNGVDLIVVQDASYGVVLDWSGKAQVEGGFGTPPEITISATSYDVEIVPVGKESTCSNATPDSNAICLHNTTVRYANYTFAPHYNGQYELRVRMTDIRCNTHGPWTQWSTFNVTGLPVNGTVYVDPNVYSVFNSAANMCYSNNAAGLNVGPNNQLKIVDAPGLLGEYYNAYPTGDGPTCSAFDCFVNNGYQYFTATPRARYDQFIPGQRWGFNSTHNLFNMPGTEDGATGGGGGVRYTATVTPTNNPPTTLTANYVFGIVGTASPIRAYVDGVQVTSQNWPGVATNYINPVSMTVGHTYKLEFEYMEGKGGYLPEFLWWASSAVISPNDTVNGTTLAGAGTNVSQTESNKTTSVTVDSSGKFSQAGEMAGNGKFILTPTDTTYGCVCPTGCTYSGLDTPAFGKDYFIAKGFAGPPTPSPSPSPTPIPVLPWWQIDRGGDVITSGNLQSKVPSGSMFSLNGSGGFPGNNMFGGTTTLTTGNVSSQGWLGDLGSTGYQGKRYDSAYFNSIIPTNITNAMNSNLPSIATQTNFDAGTAASDGYVYFKVNGDLTMNGTLSVAGTKKIVLFVTGNLNLNGNISVGTNGQGFFMAIVGGNINVAPGVTSGANTALEGIFETDGDFSLGGGSNQLRIRGSVITYGNFILNRNTGLAPASEIVEYAPDLILLFPRALIQDTYGWSEVVP